MHTAIYDIWDFPFLLFVTVAAADVNLTCYIKI